MDKRVTRSFPNVPPPPTVPESQNEKNSRCPSQTRIEKPKQKTQTKNFKTHVLFVF